MHPTTCTCSPATKSLFSHAPCQHARLYEDTLLINQLSPVLDADREAKSIYIDSCSAHRIVTWKREFNPLSLPKECSRQRRTLNSNTIVPAPLGIEPNTIKYQPGTTTTTNRRPPQMVSQPNEHFAGSLHGFRTTAVSG